MFVSTWTPRTGDSAVVGLCAVVIDPRASGTLEARMPVVVRVPSFFIRWMGRHHTMCRNCAAPLYHMRWRTCSSWASSRKFSSTSRCNLRSRTGVDVPDPCTGRKMRVMAGHTLSLSAAGCCPLEMCQHTWPATLQLFERRRACLCLPEEKVRTICLFSPASICRFECDASTRHFAALPPP